MRPEVFGGGLSTAALGVVLQFSVACAFAAIHFAAAPSVSIKVRKPVVSALAFGAAVYLVMNYAVHPFSAVSRSDFSFGLLSHRFIAHTLFVGLPIALFVRRSTKSAVLTISIS